ncbi:MAG: response regulator transcription factor [Gammaproteobacteria bacterium]|nr:response regulator transcription factor [Gammaproteobacteria bacterium]
MEKLPNYPVYLVDDDEAVRTALQLLLKTADISAQLFGDPRQFLASLNTLSPGCIILDIRMPMISGFKLQERLSEHQITWPVIVISGHGDIEACRKAFKNGAIDYLSKPIDEQDLIDSVQKGFESLEKSQLLLAERKELNELISKLTKRESQVFDLVARGFSTKECADALSLSPRTVETHRAHIASKLGTNSVAELARIASECGKTQ